MSRSDSIEEGGNIVDPDGPSEPGKAGKPGKSGKPNQPAGSWSPSPRVEYSLIGLLAIFVFAASWLGFSQVAEPLIPNVDLWFDADTRRAYLTMTVLDAKRSSVHPIFPSLARVLMQPFERLLSGPLPAVHALTATLAAFWWLLHVAVLRRVGCGLAAALVFSCLAASSAASVFFHTVPETYALGSIGILLALWASAGTTSAWEIVALNVLTLGTTVTNWMAGLLASVASRGLKRGALLALVGLAVVFAVWLLQSTLFTRNAAFWNVQAELPWLLRPEAGGIVARLRGFFFHSMLMPDFIIVPKTYWTALDLWSGPQQLLFLTQSAAAGSGSRAGPVAILLWAGLLVAGGIALFRGDAPVRFRAVLGLTLLGQLGLHLLYGIETFLYSLHYLPLLTLLAALASRGTNRGAMVSTIAAACLVPLVLGNNLRQFEIAAVALQTGSSNVSKSQITNRVDGTPQRLLVSLTFDGREPARAGWPTSLQGSRDGRCLVRDLPSGLGRALFYGGKRGWSCHVAVAVKPNTAYLATRRILAGDSAVDLVVAASEQLVSPNAVQAYRAFAAAARDVSRSDSRAQRFPPPQDPHVWEEGELLLQTGPTTRSLIMTIQRPPAVEGPYSTAVWFDDWRIVEVRAQ